MSMKKTLIKNLPGQKAQIFFLKATIIKSIAQTSFKRFILERAQYNPITIGILLFPFTLYFSFSQASVGNSEGTLQGMKFFYKLYCRLKKTLKIYFNTNYKKSTIKFLMKSFANIGG